MAVLGLLTLAQITDAIRRHIREPDTGQSSIADTVAGSGPTATYSLGEAVNIYLQGLRLKVERHLRAEGMNVQDGTVALEMWRTSGNLTESSGSATVWFPTDFDLPISFKDSTDDRPIHLVRNPRNNMFHVERWPPGPPEYIVIEGFHDNGGTWQRRGRLIPAPPSGVTPDIATEYYRVPADLNEADAANVSPDIDPRFQEILIYGVAADLMATSDPNYQQMRQKEAEMLNTIAKQASFV